MDPIGDLMQLAPGVADAGQMGHHGEAEIPAQQIAHLGGPAAGVAAGPVGDRDKIRRDALERGRRQAQGFDARVVFWRKELERSQRTIRRKELGNGLIRQHHINISISIDMSKEEKSFPSFTLPAGRRLRL